MNGSNIPTPSYGQDGGVSGRMKAFFLLVLLFLVFLLVSSSSLGQADLTPGTGDTYTDASSSSAGTFAQQPQVIAIQDNPTPAASNDLLLPVTGSCANPYTVQDGDYLSRIAAICDTTVAAIRLANPSITNANIIYPGQKLTIPVGSSQQVPVTGNTDQSQPAAAPTAASLTAPQAAPTAAPLIQQTGLVPQVRAGTMLQVKALNYPPNAPVNIAMGPKNAGYNVVAAGITDTNGVLLTNVRVPSAPDTQTPWVVVVTTTTNPVSQAMSLPFYIIP